MSYEEEFDKIIRDKVGEADYPFDESNWVKTSRLIDAERAGVKGAFWSKTILPIAIVVVGVVSYVAIDFNDDKKVADASNLESPASSHARLVPETNDGSSVQRDLNNNSVSSENNIHQPSSLEPFTGSSTGISDQPSAEQASAEQSDNKTLPFEITRADKKVTTSKAVIMSNVESGKTKETKAAEILAATTVTKKNKSTSTNDAVPNKEDDAGDVIANRSNETPADEHIANEQSAFEAAAALDASQLEPVEVDYLTSHQSLLPFALEPGFASTSFNLMSRYDEDYYSKKPKTHFLNVEAGGSYLLGWTTQDGQDGKGLNWFAGVNYGYYMGKFSLGFGVQAYNISNMNSAFHKVEQTEYSFGSSKSYTNVTTNDMFYMGIPLRASYHLNRSNHIGIGLNMGYLVAMRNSVESYSVDELGTHKLPTETNKNLYEGVRSLNYMGSVFYNARLSNRFAVQGEFIYSFTDMFQNNEAVKNAEKPMGLRLGVQYYLFDK